ncbi:class I SAM-dependent methyltransferase [Janibacter sp. DB-40]|uniref:class I SAM-dependent methyltransferase n=1 Tax=Janibacter sp. DB-40 TaxID=3028808 RepID=UPI00240725AA|nr:class I SAM-dependent methyltransferase [Janibacter sp. DB-40]
MLSVPELLKKGPARQLARRVSARSRARKIDLLRTNIRPGSRVLLVGVSPEEGIGTESAVERGLLDHAQVTCLVYGACPSRLWGRPTLRGDARALPFADGSFDYVVSNAVIEHVGGPDGARQMITESRRVGRLGYLHTTPNRWFPIEPHLMVPLVHWLPEKARQRGFAALGFSGYTRSNYWLFSRRTLRELGANASRCTGRWPAMTLLAHSEPLARDT